MIRVAAMVLLLAAAPVSAQAASTLVLELSPGARVASSEALDEGILRISLWHQDLPVGAQVAASGVAEIITFSAVPLSEYSIRLDLRLDASIQGVDIVRVSPERLEITFAEHRGSGAAVRLAVRRWAAATDRQANMRADDPIAAILMGEIWSPATTRTRYQPW